MPRRNSADDSESPRTEANLGAPVSAERTPSVARPKLGPDAAPTSDTLLSVPAPSTAEELFLDERLTASEQKLTDLEVRIDRLERQPAPTSESTPRSYWVWLVFLAGLAVAWQIVEHFR